MTTNEYDSIINLEYNSFFENTISIRCSIIYECESCNSHYIQIQKFCSNCGGNKLKAYRNVRICKNCKKILMRQKFCPDCGQKTE